MRRFKPGQEVVCVHSDWKIETLCGFMITLHYGPKVNEIVTVDDYESDGFISLIEYYGTSIFGQPYVWDESCFEPVVPQSEIDKVMEEISVKNEYYANGALLRFILNSRKMNKKSGLLLPI